MCYFPNHFFFLLLGLVDQTNMLSNNDLQFVALYQHYSIVFVEMLKSFTTYYISMHVPCKSGSAGGALRIYLSNDYVIVCIYVACYNTGWY